MGLKPDCGGGGDFARWETRRGRDEDDDDVNRWDDESGSGEPSGSDPDRNADRESPAEAEYSATARAYDDHRMEFIAAGGRGSKFDALRLMAAARLTAARMLNGLRLGRGHYERPATEQEIRVVLKGLAREATDASIAGRLRVFRRRLWPFGETPPRR